LITAQYSTFPPLETFIKNAKAKIKYKEEHFQNHAGFLAFKILKELYSFSVGHLDQLYLKINKIEKEIFDGNEKAIVKKISFLKRDILDFRRTIYPHDSVLASFEQSGKEFFGEDFSHYINFLSGEHIKIKNLIESGKEIIETLHETNESLLSTKTNEVIKILTILAFITFPLMLLSGIFGMNTESTPIIGIRGDFWIITMAMLAATLSMFVYFKKKKWL
jgi:magnesium transporter